MKVYMVEQYDEEDQETVGIFSTLEKAQELVMETHKEQLEEYGADYGPEELDGFVITEFEVDGMGNKYVGYFKGKWDLP